MGAWGVGITSNDAAQDLKKDFQAAFSYYDVETALAKIDAYVRSDGYDESDESDWCDYYFSLANFMWKKGILYQLYLLAIHIQNCFIQFLLAAHLLRFSIFLRISINIFQSQLAFFKFLTLTAIK